MDDWDRRLTAEFDVGNITRSTRDVGLMIAGWCRMGYPEPSETTIADKARCSRSTVQRAKRRLRELGLLDWVRQVSWREGLREERPCLYQATLPDAPVQRRERQKGGGKSKIISSSSPRRSREAQLAALPSVTPEQIALVERRRTAMREAWSRRGWRSEA